MIMIATVIRTNAQSLLVRDSATGNEVLVHFSNAGQFSPGETIRITFNGIMTHSLPPQITATSIARMQATAPQPPHTQTGIQRAVILQVRRNALLVRDLSNNRQVIVNYPHAHHFCVGQQISVRYETILLNNPPQVMATSISPIC